MWKWFFHMAVLNLMGEEISWENLLTTRVIFADFQRSTSKEKAIGKRQHGWRLLMHRAVLWWMKKMHVGTCLYRWRQDCKHFPAANMWAKGQKERNSLELPQTSLVLPENKKHTKWRYLESHGRAWKSTLKGSQQTISEVLCRCHCPFVCVAVESVCTEEYTQVCVG